MQFADINGIKTCVYNAGQAGPDVLLLHGWGSSARMWLRTMWALRGDYRLWAVDLPGFGHSDAPDLDWYSIERYTHHLAALCDQLGIRPEAVVGHSMGGRTALDFARRYPDLAGRVVAVSPALSGRLSFNLDLLLMGGMGHVLMQMSRHVWPVALVNTMIQYWGLRYIGSEGVKRTTADLRRSSWEGAVGTARALIGSDLTPALADVRQPVLLLCGDRDFTVPPDDSRMAARILPDARLLVLEGVHHQPTDEVPAAYLDALRSFLAEEIGVSEKEALLTA